MLVTPKLTDIRSSRRMDDALDVTFTFTNTPAEITDINTTALIYYLLAQEIRAFSEKAKVATTESTALFNRLSAKNTQ